MSSPSRLELKSIIIFLTCSDGRLALTDGKSGKVDISDLYIEVSNGCICCSVKDDLVLTLERLIEKNSGRIDHIIIETSGLADPIPLIQSFWVDNELESKIYLNGVVSMVDLRHFNTNVSAASGVSSVFQKQICCADVILLNKLDLVEDITFLNSIQNRIGNLNPFAKTVSCTFSHVPDLKAILSLNSFSGAGSIENTKLSLKLDPLAGIMEHSHDVSVTSRVVIISAPVEKSRIEQWLGILLWERCKTLGVDIFRIKGVLHLKEDSEVSIIQGVRDSFEIYQTSESWESDDFRSRQETKIIFIGIKLHLLDLNYPT